tara:strand:+ start:467 stop:652 length:186 start_codon:yes stop_codon:yes gene_type:complete
MRINVMKIENKCAFGLILLVGLTMVLFILYSNGFFNSTALTNNCGEYAVDVCDKMISHFHY